VLGLEVADVDGERMVLHERQEKLIFGVCLAVL